jgi:phosphoribosyl 1,2-cyclic phosphodiesterase/ActR/RegA family two-component response regulator
MPISLKQHRKVILLAEPSKELVKEITHHPAAKHYHFDVAKSGKECLKKIEQHQPQLVILDLFLPEIHGIEILKLLKSKPETEHIGVIVSSAQSMIQNYHAVLKSGGDFFLEKPFKISFLFSLIEKFFQGKLHPDPFTGIESKAHEGEHCFVPRLHSPNHYIKFWGTRGSNPVSGAEYVRYGGNTSCLEVRSGHDFIIIDAGTGIRSLGQHLSVPKAQKIHLFISHTHWDHITGFPFFQPIYNPDLHIVIWTPIGFEKSARELFTDMLAYAYFPVRLDDIQARITFKELREGCPVKVGEITVNTHYAYHPGATLCFKIQMQGKTFGYATDNEVLMGYHGNPNAIDKNHSFLRSLHSMIKFFKSCDFLIHEAQYSPLEYQNKVGWGHSSITNASILVKHAQIKEWIVTHHDPKHTDTDLQKKIQLHKDVLEDAGINCYLRMAYDGLMIPL